MEDDRIGSIYRKIEREKALITAARSMRQSTDNASVQQRCDSSIRDMQRNISYFEGKMRELQSRQMQATTEGIDGLALTNPNSHLEGTPPPPPKGSRDERAESFDGSVPKPPFAQQAGPGMPKSRPHYSKLDLIKYDTPHLGPRITLMLSQLAFKLSVEKQYKEGIEKMARLYQMEGDRKAKSDADAKRIESNQKIQLLKQALKRYEDLHVDMDSDVQGDDDSINTPNTRRPLTGRLEIKVIAVRDVDHAATSRFARGPESFVIVKVEDVIRGKTRATRNDRWVDESHDIDVDKANEIEITLYDQPSNHPLPIGMLWIRISDIVEELRRKKIEQDISSTGWVSAENMETSNRSSGFGGAGAGAGEIYGMGASPRAYTGLGDGNAGSTTGKPILATQEEPRAINIDAWFVLEPVGQIHLELGFVKFNKNNRPLDLGLGRKGAVRKQKEEVHEMYGHKFVQQQFYNIMRCAYCGDFLKYSAGYQCADCKYTCHKKCYQGVVTKCIAKSNAESDPDEEKLNHRIPHRFVATTNLGANWCCHCGYMLPVGKKNARKCTECQLTCHAQCAHLVPDFCGMSMEKANEILKQIKDSKRKQGPMQSRTLRPVNNAAGRSPSISNMSGDTLSYGQPIVQDPKRTSSASEYPSQITTGIPTAPSLHQTLSYMTPQPSTVNSTKAAVAVYNPNTYVPPPPSGPPPQTTRLPPIHQNTPSSISAVDAAAAAAAAAAALAGTSSPVGKRPAPAQSNPNYRTSQASYFPPPTQDTDYSTRPYSGTSASATSPLPSTASQDSQILSKHGRPTSGAYVSPPPPLRSLQAQGFPSPDGAFPPRPVVNDVQSVTKPSPYTQSSPQTVAPLVSKNVPATKKIGLDHFNFLAVLGKGNFGKVMLAETKASKQLYAIKVLKKEFIIENDEVESTRSEKRVFLIANKEKHPFLLNLHACFQTETRVYFVMEYISGGDLMLHIQRGQFGTKRAQFYAAEVCLALKYFHENGVIYRDLKLDNIMLTLDGHIKVADYGLCKEEMWYGSTTSTFCGTPEFMAPEILLDKRYGRAVDWWAFGVLIYQMLLQQSPFRGDDEDEIYDAILSDEPLYPIHMPRDSVSILQKLLTREPELRLGSGPTDAQEIMSHAFFRNVNWDDIYNKRVPSPFQPQISSATDTSNFDQEFTSVTPVLTPVQSVLTQAMQEEFRGFSYTADFV